jgi:hypothetical protein|tara:strand:- start:31 stop:780 length:750 start_codon:yes stop_codon:yes gene_type:complete
LIVIAPTYRRASSAITHKILPCVVYAAHGFEIEDYRQKGHKVIALPDNTMGNIARVRNWLIEYALEKKQDRLLLVDDDLISVQEFYDSGPRPKKLIGKSLKQRIESCFDLSEQWGTALWGINCVSEKGGFKEYTPFSLKRYCSASFHGMLLSRIGSIRYDEDLPLKEDYDLCLQLLNRDRKTLRVNSLSMTKNDHKNEGGCAMYRNTKKEAQQMKALVRKWGSQIVQDDSLSREKMDINPVIRVPIAGV